MEVTQAYDGTLERTQWIIFWESQGYRMLHDDFDSNWKRGDEPYGLMIFTDDPGVPSQPLRYLPEEIDDLKSNQLKHCHLNTLPLDPDYISASILLANSPESITMPEIWSLLRIFARLHGIP